MVNSPVKLNKRTVIEGKKSKSFETWYTCLGVSEEGVNKSPTQQVASSRGSEPKHELINRIQQLEAHNKQLKSIISKQNNSTEKQDNDSRKRKRTFDFSRYPKKHIALKLLYLGWSYQGFATIEDSTNTIEHHLFNALKKSCLIESRESANYNRCGRTDKTVSAFEQVISLTVRASGEGEPPLEYCKILNRLLPKDIRTYAWKPVPDTFSARFDCKKRTYRYFFPRGNLDVQAMQEGAEHLLGTHDFRNLCKMDVANGVTEFMRTIESVEINTIPAPTCSQNSGYNMCELVVSSKGFLWHQIRCIMGVLLLIGRQLEQPEIIPQLLDVQSCPRKPQYSLAVGEPLNLFCCEFELDCEWNVDKKSLREVIQTLQQEWALHSIKSTMLGQMLNDLETLDTDLEHKFQASGLLQGTSSRVYNPLLNRPTCESLETRIAHYVEKKKLEIRPEESG